MSALVIAVVPFLDVIGYLSPIAVVILNGLNGFAQCTAYPGLNAVMGINLFIFLSFYFYRVKKSIIRF